MHKGQIHIRLPIAQKEQLERMARQKSIKLSELTRSILSLYIDCHLQEIDPQLYALREFLGLNPIINEKELVKAK
jgi:hypothetical protein